jgi:large repetitive protein
VITQVSETRADGNCPSNYTLTRTWTATDHANNSTSGSQVITVRDTMRPTFSTPPTDRSANADDHCQANLPDFTAGGVANDNCSGVTLSQRPVAGTSMPAGHNSVRVTATDFAGNSNSVEVYFDVTDNTPPVIACPANIMVVDNAAGSCGANVDPGTPKTSDNCGVKSVIGQRSDSKALNDLYPVGSTTITWTAIDFSNNKTSCAQTVTVTNPQPTVAITGPVAHRL